MLTFDPIIPLWLIILLFMAATTILLWKESGRKLRFRILRLIAVVAMMFALAAIVLRPHTNTGSASSVLLLTPGYKIDTVDSLLTEYSHLQLVNAPGTEPYKNSRALPSYYAVRDISDGIQFVSGQGLPMHALDLLDQKNFTLIPGNTPGGIVELSVPRQIVVNRRSSVEGKFQNISGARSIVLHGPGGKEDSITLKDGMTPFNLSFTPRLKGNVLYSLTITDILGNKQQEEKLPITVTGFSPLRVLIVLSFPTFETTFLKNFIAGKGNQLVIRSQLSRNNSSYEYINHKAVRFSTLTKSVLNEFDLLIADEETMRKLSRQESLALKESIYEGLGLLSLYETASKQKTDNTFFPFKTVTAKGDTTTIRLGLRKLTLHALPFRIDPEIPMQKVLANESGILSGYTFSGKGKIGFQLLRETYRLMLEGDTISYGNLWSPLIERLSRTINEESSITITSPFPHYTDEPVHVRLISHLESPALMADSVSVPLREDVLLDDVWHATVWPSTPGWHTIEINGEKAGYFVSSDEEWRSLSIANQIKENSLTSRKGNGSATTSNQRRKISPLVFYVTFLFASGFLWLAPKL